MKNLILTLLSISILSCGSLLTPSSQVVETNDAVETNNPNEKFLGSFGSHTITVDGHLDNFTHSHGKLLKISDQAPYSQSNCPIYLELFFRYVLNLQIHHF